MYRVHGACFLNSINQSPLMPDRDNIATMWMKLVRGEWAMPFSTNIRSFHVQNASYRLDAHYPCLRVSTARELGYCVPSTRVHGPHWQKALSCNTRPVNTGRVHGCSVYTTRVHGIVRTGARPRTRMSRMTTVLDTCVHGPWTTREHGYVPTLRLLSLLPWAYY